MLKGIMFTVYFLHFGLAIQQVNNKSAYTHARNILALN